MSLTSKVKSYNTNSAKAGAKGLELAMNTIDHMFEHADWTPLAWLISGSQDTDKSRIRAIVGACVGGVTIKKDAKQPTGLRITVAENAATSDKMPLLRELVGMSTSFRSKQVNEIGLLEKTVTEFDEEKYAAAVRRKLEKEGVTFHHFALMLEAA